MTQEVSFTEVYLREERQTLKGPELEFFKPEHFAHIVQECHAAGIDSIEIGSLVSPKHVPSMGPEFLNDIFTVVGKQPEGKEYIVLVAPKQSYVEAFFIGGLGHMVRGYTVALFPSMYDGFCMQNLGMKEEVVNEDYSKIANTFRGCHIDFIVAFSAAFGFRDKKRKIESGVDQNFDKFADTIKMYLEEGAKRITLADSQGVATAQETSFVIGELAKRGIDPAILAYHPHTTTPRNYEKLFAAYDAGVRHFDTTLGTGGGCAMVDAPGNLRTYGSALMLEEYGVETNIEFPRIERLERWIAHNITRQVIANRIK